MSNFSTKRLSIDTGPKHGLKGYKYGKGVHNFEHTFIRSRKIMLVSTGRRCLGYPQARGFQSRIGFKLDITNDLLSIYFIVNIPQVTNVCDLGYIVSKTTTKTVMYRRVAGTQRTMNYEL